MTEYKYPKTLPELLSLESLQQRKEIGPINYNKSSQVFDDGFRHDVISTGKNLHNSLEKLTLIWRGWNLQDALKMQTVLYSNDNRVLANIHYYYNVQTGDQCKHKFKEIAQNNNQENSHNSSNPQSPIEKRGNQGSPSGGIENKIGIISSMINNYEEIFENDYFLSFKTQNGSFPFTDIELKQIIRELVNGIYIHDNFPFFSLHFNSKGQMFPIIHPAYENTLCGRIIGLLDYFMKGFLNGGFFHEKDIDEWNNSMVSNNPHNLENMFDYCRTNMQDDKDYVSLRHLMQLYHIKQHGDLNKYTGDLVKNIFQITFRIISEQKMIEKHQDLLLFHPDFEVEYTIEILDPGYKSLVDSYKIEKGKYPPDMENLDLVCKLFTKEIKEKMPKLPICRNYFEMLGVINGLCYFLKTLKRIHKFPVLPPFQMNNSLVCPTLFPPIPVEYLDTKQTTITLWNIVSDLYRSDKLELDKLLINQTSKEISLSNSMEKSLLNSMRNLIPKNSIGYPDDVLSDMIKKMLNNYKSLGGELSEGLKNLRNKLNELKNQERNTLNDLYHQIANVRDSLRQQKIELEKKRKSNLDEQSALFQKEIDKLPYYNRDNYKIKNLEEKLRNDINSHWDKVLRDMESGIENKISSEKTRIENEFYRIKNEIEQKINELSDANLAPTKCEKILSEIKLEIPFMVRKVEINPKQEESNNSYRIKVNGGCGIRLKNMETIESETSIN